MSDEQATPETPSHVAAPEVEAVAPPDALAPAVEIPEPSAVAPVPAEPEANGAPAVEVPPPNNKRWYVVKVTSGREDTIKAAVERRVKIENLEEFYGQIFIPTEKVVEMRDGKRRTKERKLFPGYLMVEVEYNDRILYLFRETSGVGDFVGGSVNRDPPPMSDKEIKRMVRDPKEKQELVIPDKPKFDRGDRVKVKEGVFNGMEGEVKEILEAKGLVRVEVTIFGRPVPVELEYWQVDPI